MKRIRLDILFLGTEETLNTFTGDTLRQYIKDHYTPENVVVSIAGNIDEAFFTNSRAIFR